VSDEKVKIEADFTVAAQIEARAAHPELENKVLLMHDDRSWTYRQYRDESVRMAHFLRAPRQRRRRAARPRRDVPREPPRAALAVRRLRLRRELTLFGVNTGLRGEVLAGVLNQSRARVLVVDERCMPEVEKGARRSRRRSRREHPGAADRRAATVDPSRTCAACLDRRGRTGGKSLDAPAVDVAPETNLMVIYTSGTTGLPKGINNNHMKLCFIGAGVSGNIGLTSRRPSATPACRCSTPTRSSSASCRRFWAGGSMACASASAPASFVPDVLRATA
jgi:fatty-acyl-CoA synthase